MQAENLRVLALVITILAIAVIGLSLVSAFGFATWLIAYTQQAETAIMLTIAGGATLLNNLAFLVSMIPVLIWIFLANGNLRRAGLTGLRYSPAFASLSFLIPVANLYVPFVAIRELANRSAGEPEELADADVEEVIILWGCFVGAMLLSTIVFITTFLDALPGVFMTTPFWANPILTILAQILTAGSAYALMQIVRQVTHNQMNGVSEISVFE